MDQDQAAILELTLQVIDSGRLPEEVCSNRPELLGQIRRLSKLAQAFDGEIKALFPSADELLVGEPAMSLDRPLPRIPGYDIQSVLGYGGMGVVYKATHVSLNRVVAIKVPLAGAMSSVSEKQRHLREAQAVAALGHPNIVTVHDVGEVDGNPYFTMEFVDGPHLGLRLANVPRSAREAASMLATLADAVACAHRAGIIHRDLKPANILVTADGTPKITDFGLARQPGADTTLTLPGWQFGTPSYMAPEQASGKSDGQIAAVDIYALGAILYEMLTGRPPFRGESTAETVRQVVEAEPVPPSRLNTRVPRDLETICLACLHKDPARRYPTASALAEDVRRYQRGEAITARRTSSAERLIKWARRHPGVSVAAVCAVILLAAGGTALGRSLWVHAELKRSMDEDLAELERSERRGNWGNAREALERAKGRLGDHPMADARERLHRAELDLQLVDRLAAIRLGSAEIVGRRVGFAESAAQYREAFGRNGLDLDVLPPADAAERVAASPIRRELIAALDDWSVMDPSRERVERIYAVARAADPDPRWRDKVRSLSIMDDSAALAALAAEASIEEQSPSILIALSRRLDRAKGDSVGFARRVQAQFPSDFWVNLQLAILLQGRRSPESIGYYLAAQAIRPDAMIVPMNLSAEMSYQGRTAEAMAYAQRAIALDPHNATVHANLGVCMMQLGRYDEALAACRESLSIDRGHTFATGVMCQTLMRDGRFKEARAEARAFLDTRPQAGPETDALESLVALYTNLIEQERQLDDVLVGRVSVTPERRRDLAAVCLLKRRYVNAVQLYEEAFAADSSLTSDPGSQSCFQAASAAARAAELAPDLPARVGLLNKAVLWLRADVDRWSEVLAGGNESERQALLNTMYTWRWEPRLSSIREPAAIRAWPLEQQAQCRALWRDVETLIARAQLAAPSGDLSPGVAITEMKRGRERAAKADWSGALASYARILEQGPRDDGEFWFECAAVLLLSGDSVGYRTVCDRMSERAGTRGVRAYHVARAATLADSGLSDASLLDRLAKHPELQRNAAQFWAQTERGALAYRDGRFEEATSFFQQSLKSDPLPGRAVVNWLWLALTCKRLDRIEEALGWLTKAQDWLDQYRDGVPSSVEAGTGLHLHNWLEANVLHREAEALLSSQ